MTKVSKFHLVNKLRFHNLVGGFGHGVILGPSFFTEGSSHTKRI